jgi:hypothetical protein
MNPESAIGEQASKPLLYLYHQKNPTAVKQSKFAIELPSFNFAKITKS